MEKVKVEHTDNKNYKTTTVVGFEADGLKGSKVYEGVKQMLEDRGLRINGSSYRVKAFGRETAVHNAIFLVDDVCADVTYKGFELGHNGARIEVDLTRKNENPNSGLVTAIQNILKD